MNLDIEFEKIAASQKNWQSKIEFNEEEDPNGEPKLIDLTPHTMGTDNPYTFPPKYTEHESFPLLESDLCTACIKAGFVLVRISSTAAHGGILVDRLMGCSCSVVYKQSKMSKEGIIF